MNDRINPKYHHRRSIRLKGYDYSQDGCYFITLCTKNREHLFGEIIDGFMNLNNTGIYNKEEWERTAIIRRNIVLGEFIIMPNHFHGIVKIAYSLGNNNGNISKFSSPSNTIGAIIRGFKGTCSRHFFAGESINESIWQKNYWERVIRSEIELNKITQYIKDNPKLWNNDKLNNGAGNIVSENVEQYNSSNLY